MSLFLLKITIIHFCFIYTYLGVWGTRKIELFPYSPHLICDNGEEAIGRPEECGVWTGIHLLWAVEQKLHCAWKEGDGAIETKTGVACDESFLTNVVPESYLKWFASSFPIILWTGRHFQEFIKTECKANPFIFISFLFFCCAGVWRKREYTITVYYYGTASI